jgi:hypothetical protein
VGRALVTVVLALSMPLATGCSSTAPVSKEELTGIAGNADIVVALDAALPFEGISSIETREFNLVRELTLVGGIGLGAVFGGRLDLALSSGGGSNEHSFGWVADVASIALLFGAAGGVLGGIPGAIIGHSYEYPFVTTAPGTKK